MLGRVARSGSRLFARALCAEAPSAPTSAARLTKIVATIGPASEEAAPLAGCVAGGLNVLRCNFSHATVDEFHLRRKNLRASPGSEYCSVMLDTKGPEIRMGGLRICKESGDRKAKMTLTAGATILLTNDATYNGASDEKTLFVDYAQLTTALAPGNTVLLDDGLVSLRVNEVGPDGVQCEVLNTSDIGERKGVNLPGVKTGLPAMSEKDKEDIRFGIEHDIDMVAASFVRNAEGVEEIRAHIEECHAQYCEDADHTPPPMIIAKIESTEALENLWEIIEAADGIMVARGDLGVEVPLEQVVTWQKDMVQMCIAAGKPVVVATQMLESMQKNPRPTRAEVGDVTNAVLELADAVMLSGESANGKYPVQSVETQASIVRSTELWARARGVGVNLSGLPFDDDENEEALGYSMMTGTDFPSSVAASAAFLADRVGAVAILAVDDGLGQLARILSATRPPVPIVAINDSLKVCRQLSISRGVYPHYEEQLEQFAEPQAACEVAAAMGILEEGDKAVVMLGDSVTAVTYWADDESLDEYGVGEEQQ